MTDYEDGKAYLQSSCLDLRHFIEDDFECKNLTQILNGVQDVIVVYSPEQRILFMNKQGEELIGTYGYQVTGKGCQAFCKSDSYCMICPLNDSIDNKRFVSLERCFDTYNRFMTSNYNPVFNNEGEVKYVVAQMRDITENKKLQMSLEKSKRRYKDILNAMPDPVVIFQGHKIVYANKTSEQLEVDLVGKRIEDLDILEKDIMLYRSFQTLKEKSQGASFDYTYKTSDRRTLNLELTSRYIEYNDQPAIMAIVRDISEKKQGLINAAKIQKNYLPKTFPLKELAEMKVLYQPARTVSGDFYALEKISDTCVVGLIGDVAGKGITAAMNISAFNVLFKEAVDRCCNPKEIVDIMNRKSVKYFGERYTAVCCFAIDFEKNIAHIVGAGISNCIHIRSQETWQEHILRGPFLGMFDDPEFDEIKIELNAGDELVFYSDGLDDYLRAEAVIDEYGETLTSDLLHDYLEHHLEYLTSHIKGLSDDCTMLSLRIK